VLVTLGAGIEKAITGGKKIGGSLGLSASRGKSQIKKQATKGEREDGKKVKGATNRDQGGERHLKQLAWLTVTLVPGVGGGGKPNAVDQHARAKVKQRKEAA